MEIDVLAANVLPADRNLIAKAFKDGAEWR